MQQGTFAPIVLDWAALSDLLKAKCDSKGLSETGLSAL
jgi:hypothetical protein